MLDVYIQQIYFCQKYKLKNHGFNMTRCICQSIVSVLRWWAAFLHLAILASRLLPITQSITPQSYAILCFQTVLGKLKKAHLLFKIPWLRGGMHLSHSYSTCELYLGAIGYTLPLRGQVTLLSFPSANACREKGGGHSGICLAVSIISVTA